MNHFFNSPTVILGIYCSLVVLGSLGGGWITIALRLTHSRLQALISFVAGLMLGMALLHLIPHSHFQLHSLDKTMAWVLSGFLVMFFLQRLFHFHHHDLPDKDPEDCCPGSDEETDHGHGAHAHTLAAKSAQHLTWTGTAIGLSLHSLLDGVALAAAVAAEAKEGFGLVGFGTALAIILHKPFDSIAVSALMSRNGCSRAARHLFNGIFALIAPLGVVLFSFGASQFSSNTSTIIGCALGFSGGMFLCISCSDLLPELQFHSHDRWKLSCALALGVFIAAIIGKFETSGHDEPSQPPVHMSAP